MNEDGMNVDLEDSDPLDGEWEMSVSYLACCLSLEKEKEYLGVHLLNQGTFVCVLYEVGLIRLRDAFYMIFDGYQDAYLDLFVLGPSHTRIRLIFECSCCIRAWLNRIEFCGYD